MTTLRDIEMQHTPDTNGFSGLSHCVYDDQGWPCEVAEVLEIAERERVAYHRAHEALLLPVSERVRRLAEFVCDRLVFQYDENPNVDYIYGLREAIAESRKEIP